MRREDEDSGALLWIVVVMAVLMALVIVYYGAKRYMRPRPPAPVSDGPGRRIKGQDRPPPYIPPIRVKGRGKKRRVGKMPPPPPMPKPRVGPDVGR